jgi:hypothetical protein
MAMAMAMAMAMNSLTVTDRVQDRYAPFGGTSEWEYQVPLSGSERRIASRLQDPQVTQTGTPEYMLPDPGLGGLHRTWVARHRT